jgi:hypothetical protein
LCNVADSDCLSGKKLTYIKQQLAVFTYFVLESHRYFKPGFGFFIILLDERVIIKFFGG